MTLAAIIRTRFRRGITVLTAGLFLSPLAAVAQSGADRFWHPVPGFEGQSGFVDALVSVGDALYVGGNFNEIGGRRVLNCARLEGGAWESVGGAVGTPMMGVVHSVLVVGDKIYVAGMFDQLSAIFPASNIAVWDGRNWDTMAGGTDRAVRNVVRAPNGDIYIAGEFTTAGGVQARGIARWDGTSWHALGLGVNNHVMAIAFKGGLIYAGGIFSMAGSKRVGSIAAFDGNEWWELGTGVQGPVTALAFKGDALYVGGGFREAGGVSVSGFAVWSGGRFRSVGGGLSGSGVPIVRKIYVENGDVYIGGTFDYAGDVLVNNIAKWDGTDWYALGSGVVDEGKRTTTVKNITRHGDDLYVSGNFTTAGGKMSYLIARWNRPAVEFTGASAVEDGSGGVRVEWQALVNDPFEGYRVYRREVGSESEEVVSGPDPLGVDETVFTDAGAERGHAYTYTVAAVRTDGKEIRADGGTVHLAAPVVPTFAVYQNFPNPFGLSTRSTAIEYELPVSGHVHLAVYDAAGRLVTTLVDEVRPSGPSSVSWDGTDQGGNAVSSGVYLYRLDSVGAIITKKMMLLR